MFVFPALEPIATCLTAVKDESPCALIATVDAYGRLAVGRVHSGFAQRGVIVAVARKLAADSQLVLVPRAVTKHSTFHPCAFAAPRRLSTDACHTGSGSTRDPIHGPAGAEAICLCA